MTTTKKTKLRFGVLPFARLVAVILCLSFVFVPISASALTASQLQAQRDYYAAQAEAARVKAEQKAKDAALVQSQISNLDGQISQSQNAISQTQSQIDETSAKIAELETNISTQESNLAIEKTKMDQVVASWYMEGESGLFETVMTSGSVSELTAKQDYYESIKTQISGMMDQITVLKEALKSQKAEQDNQLSIASGLKADQLEQKSDLESNKSYKNQLLNYTNNTIADLKAQQAQAEAKANEIRAILATIYSSGNTPKGNQLVSSIDSSWYYNQKNYSTKLSPSSLTIAEVGCFVTSMAMVSTYYNKGKTPPDIVAASKFDYSGSWKWFTGYSGITVTSKSLDWGLVNSELDNGHPVIVSVYTGFGKVYNGDGSNHFIVIKGYSGGKYLIQDPYWTNSSYNLSDVKSIRIVRPV